MSDKLFWFFYLPFCLVLCGIFAVGAVLSVLEGEIAWIFIFSVLTLYIGFTFLKILRIRRSDELPTDTQKQKAS